MEHKEYNFKIRIPKVALPFGSTNPISRFLPSLGNVIFTLLVVASLLWAQNVGALNLLAAPNAATTSTGTIAYQGRLADSSGAPLTQTVNMGFRLYSAASGGAPLWEEQWTGANSVQVSDGLFNVMLGSLTSIPQNVITGNTNLFLGITVGTDSEMSPRVQLGSVPFAAQALTVPDGSITVAKIADGAITAAKAPHLIAGSLPNTKLAHGLVTVNRSAGNSYGFAIIDLSNHNFAQTPTPVCTISGAFGSFWDCHVEHESPTSFYIFAYRRDNTQTWDSIPVQWIVVGD